MGLVLMGRRNSRGDTDSRGKREMALAGYFAFSSLEFESVFMDLCILSLSIYGFMHFMQMGSRWFYGFYAFIEMYFMDFVR